MLLVKFWKRARSAATSIGAAFFTTTGPAPLVAAAGAFGAADGAWLGRRRRGFLLDFFQVKIDQILRVARVDPEIFRHVHERVALVVGHVVGIEAAQAQHAHEILVRTERGTGLLHAGRDRFRRRRRHAHPAAALQGVFNQPDHALVRESVLAAKRPQRLLLLRGQRLVVQGEGDVFVELRDRPLLGLGRQFVVDLFAALRIEQLDPRLGQETGRFIQPRTQ